MNSTIVAEYEEGMTMSEWVREIITRINNGTCITSPSLQTPPPTTPDQFTIQEMEDPVTASKGDLSIIDSVRIHTLASLSKQDHKTESRIKKAQRCFQQIGQNVVGHRRIYNTLQIIADKVDAIMQRIQGMEADTERTFAELQKLGEEDPDLIVQIVRLKNLLSTRMEWVERESRKEIQEIIEPSAPFMQKKRKQREVDDFLDMFLCFLNDQA